MESSWKVKVDQKQLDSFDGDSLVNLKLLFDCTNKEVRIDWRYDRSAAYEEWHRLVYAVEIPVIQIDLVRDEIIEFCQHLEGAWLGEKVVNGSHRGSWREDREEYLKESYDQLKEAIDNAFWMTHD